MRILFLSNYYPPNSRGGYELWCQEIAIALNKKGHQVHVMTTKSTGTNSSHNDNGVKVHRELWPEVEGNLRHTVLRSLKDRQRLEHENLQQVRELVTKFQPEFALVWGMWNLPRSVPALLENLLPGRVSYYICDYWLTLPNAYIQRWQEPARKAVAQLPKRLLAKHFLADLMKEPSIELRLEHPICVSRAVRDILVEAGIQVSHAQVIYGGIKVGEFQFQNADRKRTIDHLNLLFIGRLAPEKGVHTAIKAVSRLHVENSKVIKFNIYGRGDQVYEEHLRSLIKQNYLDDIVSLCGSVPHHQVPQVLASHDVLIFPSEWKEPFSRTVLEGMAAGLVVIGTTTGGTGEILVENDTGLTFRAGDYEQLASQIHRLSQDASLMNRLALNGQRAVAENFTLSRMVSQIEAEVVGLVADNHQPN